ncbi:MAG: enoyl-CoA hydratase/isomerase family protein [Geminicoccaceae bacterium]
MGEIRVQRDERGVVTLWLTNPARLNALSNTMVIGLCEEMARLADDDTCRVIVLRGSDGVFCAGRDLRDLNELRSAEPEAIARMYDYMERMNEAIYDAPHPVVSVVEKYALGIATMIVSWSDIALAEESALLGYPEVHHGITPYGAVPTMLSTMNRKAMMDLLLTGRKIDALEAVRLGIVTRAVPADQLTGAYEGVLESLFRGSAAAIRKSKRFVRECENLSYRQGIRAATEKAIAGIGTPEIKEGLAAFLDKERSERS